MYYLTIFSIWIFFSLSSSLSAKTANTFRVLSLFAKSERPPTKVTRSATSYALELALEKHSQLKNRVKFKEFESSRKISELVLQAQKVIDQFKPDVIIGGSTSNQAFVISEIAEKNHIPFLTPWATHPNLTKNKHYTFRTCFDDHYQAGKIAEFIVSRLGLKRGMILVNSRETFSVGFKDLFVQKAYKNGAKKVDIITFVDEKEVSDKKIAALKKSKIDFVVIPSYEVEAAALISRLASILPKHVRYFGPDSWGTGKILRSVLNSVGLNIDAYVVNHWSEKHQSKANKSFLHLLRRTKVYQAIQNNPNTSLTSVAVIFDAMNVIFDSFDRQTKKHIPLIEALRQEDLEGVTGEIDPGDHKKQSLSLFIYKIEPEETRFVRAYR